MSWLLSDGDLAKLQHAVSQVVSAAIGETATVLVPAVAKATGGIGVTITVGPIHVDPITITVEAKRDVA